VNQHDGFWWNALDTLTGVVIGIVGIVGAVLGWLNNRFSKMEERMSAAEQECNERDHVAETAIAKLQAYHESNIKRLDNIEDTTQRIDSKLDRLIDSLGNRSSRK